MQLSDLPAGSRATVTAVNDVTSPDPISERLRDLGFVRGEPVQLVAFGPFGAEPMLVQIGFTRFALRRGEAARVSVEQEAAHV
jgi:ferrous iron transport protein A